ELVEVRPGYRSVYMRRAKELARSLDAVRWDPAGAVVDTAQQVANVPLEHLRRIVVPVGSGLVAAGVVAGLRQAMAPEALARLEVVLVAVSTMGSLERIYELAD